MTQRDIGAFILSLSDYLSVFEFPAWKTKCVWLCEHVDYTERRCIFKSPCGHGTKKIVSVCVCVCMCVCVFGKFARGSLSVHCHSQSSNLGGQRLFSHRVPPFSTKSSSDKLWLLSLWSVSVWGRTAFLTFSHFYSTSVRPQWLVSFCEAPFRCGILPFPSSVCWCDDLWSLSYGASFPDVHWREFCCLF